MWSSKSPKSIRKQLAELQFENFAGYSVSEFTKYVQVNAKNDVRLLFTLKIRKRAKNLDTKPDILFISQF